MRANRMVYPIKNSTRGPQSMDRMLWCNGLFDVWIIVRIFPGKFPPDPEDCDANGQSDQRKEQIADFHERFNFSSFQGPGQWRNRLNNDKFVPS